jgi:hypothetical protein
VLLNWLLKKTLSQSPPLRSGRPRATWAAPRPCPASPPPPRHFLLAVAGGAGRDHRAGPKDGDGGVIPSRRQHHSGVAERSSTTSPASTSTIATDSASPGPDLWRVIVGAPRAASTTLRRRRRGGRRSCVPLPGSPPVGSATGSGRGISCGCGGFWWRSGVSGGGLPACAQGSFFVRHLATPGGRCGTVVVRRASALLREVRRRGGVSFFCSCGRRRMVKPTAGRATSSGSVGGSQCYGRRVAWAWGGGREAELGG